VPVLEAAVPALLIDGHEQAGVPGLVADTVEVHVEFEVGRAVLDLPRAVAEVRHVADPNRPAVRVGVHAAGAGEGCLRPPVELVEVHGHRGNPLPMVGFTIGIRATTKSPAPLPLRTDSACSAWSWTYSS